MSVSKRGFASMDPERQREIASKGGRAAHEKGTAHQFTTEEAMQAGRKGGKASGKSRKIKTLALALASVVLVGLSGCAAEQERMNQHFQREFNGGYPSVVRLYSLDGKLLQTWEGAKVLPTSDDNGDPSLTFIIDGRKVSISGVYSIEEK